MTIDHIIRSSQKGTALPEYVMLEHGERVPDPEVLDPSVREDAMIIIGGEVNPGNHYARQVRNALALFYCDEKIPRYGKRWQRYDAYYRTRFHDPERTGPYLLTLHEASSNQEVAGLSFSPHPRSLLVREIWSADARWGFSLFRELGEVGWQVGVPRVLVQPDAWRMNSMRLPEALPYRGPYMVQ